MPNGSWRMYIAPFFTVTLGVRPWWLVRLGCQPVASLPLKMRVKPSGIDPAPGVVAGGGMFGVIVGAAGAWAAAIIS